MDTAASTLTPSRPYFPALDGVRAWCVLLVMYDHVKAPGHTVSWIDGHLGVDVFFLLSGLLITKMLLAERQQTGHTDLVAFYFRRLVRIVPVYLVTLLIYVAVCHLPGQGLHWIQLRGGMPWFLTFLNEYAREPLGGNVFLHTWSLGIEEKFYLVWPFVFLAFARRNRMQSAFFALLAAALVLTPFTGHPRNPTAYLGLMIGCLLAMATSGTFAPRLVTLAQKVPAIVALALLIFGFLLVDYSRSLMFIFSSLAALFLLHLMVKPSWLSRFHSTKLMIWLGRRSYAMYLVHILCLNVLESRVSISSGWGVIALLLAAYFLAAVVAQLLYLLVERPTQRLGKVWLARRAQRVPAATTAS